MPKGQIIHMGISVRGALRWPRSEMKRATKWITRDDGSSFTADELRDKFMDLLAAGNEVIPIGTCDNWDPKTGCKGHPMPEEAPTT